MKIQSTKKILLSIVFLVALLIATFYAMHYVRGPQFQSGLAMLFGPSSQAPVHSWNWCPADVSEVLMLGKTYRGRAEMDPICRVEIEPMELNTNASFSPLAEAILPNGKVILESDANHEIFRVEGLPFRSRKLTEFVKGQGSDSQ